MVLKKCLKEIKFFNFLKVKCDYMNDTASSSIESESSFDPDVSIDSDGNVKELPQTAVIEYHESSDDEQMNFAAAGPARAGGPDGPAGADGPARAAGTDGPAGPAGPARAAGPAADEWHDPVEPELPRRAPQEYPAIPNWTVIENIGYRNKHPLLADYQGRLYVKFRHN